MDDFMNSGLPSFFTLVGIVITAVWGPKAVAKIQGKQKIEEIQTEGDTQAEKLYVEHVEKTLDRYERQMELMQKDFERRLAEQEERFNFRIDAVKEQFEHERKKERIYYEAEIEKRDERIEELEAIVITKDTIIAKLKKQEEEDGHLIE